MTSQFPYYPTAYFRVPMQESKSENIGKRVFAVVCRGYPQDFQAWLDTAKTYDLYVIFSKSSRIGKLVVQEEAW